MKKWIGFSINHHHLSVDIVLITRLISSRVGWYLFYHTSITSPGKNGICKNKKEKH